MMISLAIKSIMAKNVVTFKKTDSLVDIAKEMSKRKISCVVIVEKKKALGLITERDMLKLLSKKHSIEKLQAKDLMSTKVIGIQEDDAIFKAAQIMERHKIRRLPVLKGKIMVGLITETDVVKAMTNIAKYLNDKLIEYITNS